jgi:hypothetical protein
MFRSLKFSPRVRCRWPGRATAMWWRRGSMWRLFRGYSHHRVVRQYGSRGGESARSALARGGLGPASCQRRCGAASSAPPQVDLHGPFHSAGRRHSPISRGHERIGADFFRHGESSEGVHFFCAQQSRRTAQGHRGICGVRCTRPGVAVRSCHEIWWDRSSAQWLVPWFTSASMNFSRRVVPAAKGSTVCTAWSAGWW